MALSLSLQVLHSHGVVQRHHRLPARISRERLPHVERVLVVFEDSAAVAAVVVEHRPVDDEWSLKIEKPTGVKYYLTM